MRGGLLVLLVVALLSPPVPVMHTSLADQPAKDCADGSVRLADPELGADGSLPEPQPHADGRYTPILLVHGWTGNAGMWSERTNLSTLQIEPTVNHSLLGTLQGLPGAAVYTLDYAAVAHKWFLEPGAGADAFLAAERCLTGRPEFAGHRLVIVAHSMGGLIVRWSVSDAAPDGPARRNRIGLVVTLGTPYEGSDIAAIGTALADGAIAAGAAVDRRFATLLTVIHMLVAQCHDVRFVGCDQLNHLVDWLAAAHKFATGSPDMQALSAWPPSVRVETLATRTVVGDVAGLFLLPGADVALGDVIVSEQSATAGAHPQVVPECRLTADAARAGWDALMSKLGQTATIDASTYWLFGLLGICYHGNEARLIQLTNEVLGAVADELAAAEPVFAYLSGTELGVVRNQRVQYRVSGTLAGLRFTADGRFVLAVERRGTAEARVVALDTRTGERRDVPCGGCSSAAPIGGSVVGWIDGQRRVMRADLSGSGSAQSTPYRLPPAASEFGLSPPSIAGAVGDQLIVAEDMAAGASVQSGSITVLETSGASRRLQTDDVGRVAVHRSGRVALTLRQRTANCPSSSGLALAEPALQELHGAGVGTLDPGELGVVSVEDLWWGRDDALYATLSSRRCDGYPDEISLVAPGIWRHGQDGWTQLDRGPVAAVRQLTSSTKAVVLPNGTLYAEVSGQGVEVARGVTAIEMPPGIDTDAVVAAHDAVASFVGEWHVHGSSLVVRADGTAQDTSNAGPCTGGTQLCVSRGTLVVAADARGLVTMTYTAVTLTDQDGKPVGASDPGSRRAGDSFRLHLAGPGLMRLHPLNPHSAETLGNVYLCRADASAQAHTLCNA